MRLEGTTIVVTGAAAGLGAAMADAFVAEGARVACADVDQAALEETVARLNEGTDAGEDADSAIAVPTDVRSWDQVQALVAVAEGRLGPIDVYVSNAGLQQRTAGAADRAPVRDVPVDIWDAVLETNLRGAFYGAKAVLPGMLDRDAGRLMFVSSGAGSEGRANQSPYVASKFGLEGFCETLALDLEGTGVESLVFRPPSGGVYTASRAYRGREAYAHPSPDVVAGPAVSLAAGEGEHGGRYEGDPDGESFHSY